MTDDAFPTTQAYIKTEAYGFAIRDATKAVELDPAFVKVRRAPFATQSDRVGYLG